MKKLLILFVLLAGFPCLLPAQYAVITPYKPHKRIAQTAAFFRETAVSHDARRSGYRILTEKEKTP